MSASQPPASEQYASWKKYPHTYAEPTHEDWERENADLRAKLEAAQRDAERYRYIRNEMPRPVEGQVVWMRRGDDLDEAIDAAMQEGK